MTKTTDTLINDTQALVGAMTRFGHAIATFDDGFGPLWIHRNSLGISGIVRASSWHDAYSICEDEIFPAGDDFDPADFVTEYVSGRELWLHEHGNDFNAWLALTDDEKDAAYRAPGKDVPFDGEVADHPCWQEQYGFRGNTRTMPDGSSSSIYAKDLNGDILEQLTPELCEELGVKLTIEPVE